MADMYEHSPFQAVSTEARGLFGHRAHAPTLSPLAHAKLPVKASIDHEKLLHIHSACEVCSAYDVGVAWAQGFREDMEDAHHVDLAAEAGCPLGSTSPKAAASPEAAQSPLAMETAAGHAALGEEDQWLQQTPKADKEPGRSCRTSSPGALAASPFLGEFPSASHSDLLPMVGSLSSQTRRVSLGEQACPSRQESLARQLSYSGQAVQAASPAEAGLVSLFCVFDGHGGSEVAQFCARNVGPVLRMTRAFEQGHGDLAAALNECFLILDESVIKYTASHIGSCATVAAVRGDELVVAGVGDSRCVLCRGGKAEALTRDHKPTDPRETARITDAGGYVILGRVNACLNISRALGDGQFKQSVHLSACQQQVSPEPEVMSTKLTADDAFMVVACDGVWNAMGDQEVVDFVRLRLMHGYTAHTAARELVEFCLKPQVTCYDNVTVIVCVFWGQGQPQFQPPPVDVELRRLQPAGPEEQQEVRAAQQDRMSAYLQQQDDEQQQQQMQAAVVQQQQQQQQLAGMSPGKHGALAAYMEQQQQQNAGPLDDEEEMTVPTVCCLPI